MWPFRRKRDATPPSAGRADAGGPVHRSGPAAWRAARPLQVVQTTRTTVDTGFVGHLATRADPSFLAPLGHHVVPGAPAGEVHNLVTPAPTPRTFAPPPGASAVQRIVASSNPVVESGAISRPQRSLVDASEVELPPVPAPPSVRLERARPSSDRDVDLAEAAVADTG